VVRSQRKGGVGHSLLVVALQPARILAAKGRPRGRIAVSQPLDRGEGWGRACDLTQSAQLRGPTMEYLEKVRSQFLSLRHFRDCVRQTTIFYDPTRSNRPWSVIASARVRARDAKNRGRPRDCDHGRLDRARACVRRQASVRHPSGGRSPSFAPSSRGRQRGSVSSRQNLNSTGAASVRQSIIANVER
jgi:hypothetical protein